MSVTTAVVNHTRRLTRRPFSYIIDIIVWLIVIFILGSFIYSVITDKSVESLREEKGDSDEDVIRMSAARSDDAVRATNDAATTVNMANCRLCQVKGDPNTILFNRVPKCAGTTVTAIFILLSQTNKFTLQRIKENLEDDFDVKQYKAHMEKDKLKSVVDLITSHSDPTLFAGHLHFVNFTEFGKPWPVYMNIIREPFDRFASDYYYRRNLCLKRLSRWKGGCKTSNLLSDTMNECVQYNRPRCTTPNVTGYFKIIPFFCGNGIEACLTESQWALDRAKENVEKYYTTVGLMEEIDKVLEVVERLLPRFFANVTQVYRHQSGSDGTPLVMNQGDAKPETSPEMLAIMKDRMHLEYDFYYYIRQRFYKQYQQVVGTSKR